MSFTLAAGKTTALVGESGSGKSITALSILRLLPKAVRYPRGQILFDGRNLLTEPEDALRRVRGGRIGMVFQEPMTSLNPLHTIEKQIAESLFLHNGLKGAAARARVIELLEQVGFANVESRLSAYPHELSGGQRQRVMIAMALANDPEVLIADEPTTALDVTIQAQILKLLKKLQQERGLALLLITHDLGIVKKFADDVVVMQKGQMVEAGPTASVFANPQHPYTQLLMRSEPSGAPTPVPLDAAPLLTALQMKVYFGGKKNWFGRSAAPIKAVDDVSFNLRAGETLGVVGESGSGKTTLGQAVLRLISSEGAITFDGQRLDGKSWSALRPLRREMQMVFQDPYGALSPRLTMGEIVAEGLDIHGLAKDPTERAQLMARVLDEVGLDPAAVHRYPHEFSGGQRQRIAIARALVLKPKVMVLDEPTSALDLSTQAQIVDLLRALQAKYQLAYVFISHDLRVVRALSHQVMVMKNGQVVEAGSAEALFSAPQTDYTRALMAAAFNLETA